jgi:hypothetical protein
LGIQNIAFLYPKVHDAVLAIYHFPSKGVGAVCFFWAGALPKMLCDGAAGSSTGGAMYSSSAILAGGATICSDSSGVVGLLTRAGSVGGLLDWVLSAEVGASNG